MKKRLLMIVYVTLSTVCGYAQQKQGHVMMPKQRGVGKVAVIGRAQMEVQYAFNATDIKDENTYIDLHCLQAGKEVSKHFSRFLERADSLHDAYLKAHPNAGSIPKFAFGREGTYWSEYQYTEIFTENVQQTFYAWMPWAMERYNGYYTEPAAQQEWTLHDERQTILGHECQKATCHWRGRDFVAWFAPTIPVRLGPWAFGGLPGLILKIYDTGQLYTWEAVSLRSGDFPITKRDYKGFSSTTRDKIRKLQIAANRDHMKNSGAINRNTGQLMSRPHPYDPLELE